uniref:TPR repeat-containing protein DDB_G0285095 n=1 Tax=Anthurium amnicola TaxID=1678845 RepID=A0A1D1YWW9_9ARAE
MMRLEVSSLLSNPSPLPRFPSGGRRPTASSCCGCRKPASSSKATSIRASQGRSRRPHVEPPWLVLPPSPPENPFSGQAWPSDLPVKGAGGTDIPLSIRMVQMKKRMAVAAPRWRDSPPPAEGDRPGAVEGPTWRAVSALVLMVEELQRSGMAGRDGVVADESVLDRASRDRRDSFVWLLRRVFFASPNLVVSLLVLLANCVAFSAEEASGLAAAIATSVEGDHEKSEIASGATHDEALMRELEGRAAELAPETIRIGDYLNWFDIGIEEGGMEPRQNEGEESYVDRRRRAYERTIAEGGASSLILSNYAQFLYRVANDHDRAEQYFQWAAMAEPRDAEAMSQYAFFLWEVRGDITGAEEMFLEAIEAEPANHHYSSSYAWFLWKTGALDTCYPLNPSPSLPANQEM